MTAPRPRIVLIAAVARNGVIGDRGGLPWRLPGDLAHFRRETWGKPVIFGHRTLAAIGKALPGRFCILVSRDRDASVPGATTAGTLDEAMALARAEATRTGAAEIMVAGGATIYAAALPQADELRLSIVDLEPAGDTRFPPVDPHVWQEVARTPAIPLPDDEATYALVRLCRKQPLAAEL